MRRSLFVLLFLTSTTFAVDLTRDTIPRKWIEPLLPEDLPALKYPDYATPLDKARMDIFAGRYKLGLQTLRHVNDGNPVEIATLKATALSEIGQKQEAIDLLSKPPVANDPKVAILRANILADWGKLADAQVILTDVVKQHPDSIAAHYQLGRISELRGDLETARKAYQWFEDDPQKFLDKEIQNTLHIDNAEDLTYIGRALDRWATLNNVYQSNESINDTILNLFVRAYDVVDRGYWPAHIAAAEYYLSHDNAAEAGNELMAALQLNPRSAQAAELLGNIALSQFDFDKADAAVAQLRRIDPNSFRADLLESRNLLRQQRPADAEKTIDVALQKQPQNVEALGIKASAEALRLHDDRCAAILKQVDAIDPHNASAYLELAENLSAMRQYPRAEAMYKIAIDRAPWWTTARNGLGLLYTQSGDEDKARVTLEAAHSLDPYNLQTTNYLRLLDELAGFSRKESANFIVMYDAKLDPIIPEYFNDYLETVHKAVCGDFKYTPKVKTYIEVFPTHDAFSVRTTGSPWIGTVGASTGRVIALVSPRNGVNTLGSFNWSRVLRHEFTHTVTLGMTDNRIPHWFTEGLAVWEEHTPLPWDWVPMLYHAVKENELFGIDQLTWAFVRPRRPIDRQLAYAESLWICTYIEQKYGHDAILKMLAEYRNGESSEEVFQKALNRSVDGFFTDFTAWANQQIAGWGYDKATSEKYDELKETAQAMITARQYAKAADAWEQIAKLRPVDALPHLRLAGLYLTKELNEPDKAIEQLKHLSDVELRDNSYAKRIARLYRDQNDLPNAKKYAMLAVYTEPYDLSAHQLLAEVDEKAGDQAGLAREQRVIPILQQWIEDNQKRQEGEVENP